MFLADTLDIVSGITYVRSRKSQLTMAEQDFFEWPTLKPVMSRIKKESDKHIYQGSILEGYSTTLVQKCGISAHTDLRKFDVK